MFRKQYKEAMNSIKPDEAFVESVIKNAKKRKPPLYARYTKYAAAAAAAVVIVSGAVLSMPLWQKVTDNTDGIIIEETVTDNAAEGSKAAEAASPVAAAEPEAKPTAAPQVKATTAPQIPTTKTPSQDKAEQSIPAPVTEELQPQTPTTEETVPENEMPMLKKAVAGETEQQMRIASAPEDMAPYDEAMDAENSVSAKMAAVPDDDIPTPEGYYCTSASPNGYTFANDEGAVIIVTVNYGGEEQEPYIQEDGDNIYAVFTSFGLSVTINASGADRSAVEEIINSLR